MTIYNFLIKYFNDEKFVNDMKSAFTKPHFPSDRPSSDDESDEDKETKRHRTNSYLDATQQEGWEQEDWDIINSYSSGDNEESYVFYNNKSVSNSRSARGSPSKTTKV